MVAILYALPRGMRPKAAFQLRREGPSAGSAGSAALRSSREGEERGFFVCRKRFDLVATHSKQAGHLVGGAIPQPNSDYLRRRPMQDAEAMKVFVFRHDQQSVVSRVGPDCTIGCRRQTDVTDVDGTRV